MAQTIRTKTRCQTDAVSFTSVEQHRKKALKLKVGGGSGGGNIKGKLLEVLKFTSEGRLYPAKPTARFYYNSI